MGVVARRDEHEVGAVGLGRGDDDVLDERPPDLAVAAGRDGQVDRVPLPRPRPRVAERAGAGIEPGLVDGGEQHRVGVAEDLVRPVSVVDVPVEDEDPPGAEAVERVASRDGDGVEQAEALGADAVGVMAGRAHEREARRRVAAEQRLRQRAGAARGVQRGGQRLVGDGRLAAERQPPLGSRAQRVDVGLRMHRGDLLERRRPRLGAPAAQPAAALELGLGRLDALRALRMVLDVQPAVVPEGPARGVREEHGRAHAYAFTLRGGTPPCLPRVAFEPRRGG